MALNPITSNKKMTNNVTKIFPARVLYHGEGSCSIAPINKEWLQYTTILLLSTVPLTPLTVRLYFSILRPSLFTHLSPGYYFPLPTRAVEPGRSPNKSGNNKEIPMGIPSILEMLQAGVHFGHQKSRWHPKMERFIFTERNGVHIIDLEKTQAQLESVLADVKKMASEGKQILFVSTKPQARQIVKDAAEACGMPFLVDRWLGGFLTNFAEIRKLIKKYMTLKEQQASGELEKYTNNEQVQIGKQLEKMDTYLGGLVTLHNQPDALFIPAVQREKTAVTEANRTGE